VLEGDSNSWVFDDLGAKTGAVTHGKAQVRTLSCDPEYLPSPSCGRNKIPGVDSDSGTVKRRLRPEAIVSENCWLEARSDDNARAW
jgi:hypothetical protein